MMSLAAPDFVPESFNHLRPPNLGHLHPGQSGHDGRTAMTQRKHLVQHSDPVRVYFSFVLFLPSLAHSLEFLSGHCAIRF